MINARSSRSKAIVGITVFAVNDMDSIMRVECETYCFGRPKKMATATSTPRIEKAVVILIGLQALSRFLESVISVGIYHDLV